MFLATKFTFRSFGSIFATSKTITFTISLCFSTKRSFGSTTIHFTTIERNSHDFRIYYILYKYFSFFLQEKNQTNSRQVIRNVFTRKSPRFFLSKIGIEISWIRVISERYFSDVAKVTKFDKKRFSVFEEDKSN